MKNEGGREAGKCS